MTSFSMLTTREGFVHHCDAEDLHLLTQFLPTQQRHGLERGYVSAQATRRLVMAARGRGLYGLRAFLNSYADTGFRVAQIPGERST